MTAHHEDGQPNVPSQPVPDELTSLPEEERTPIPQSSLSDAVFQQMVRLSLSSMATTLEGINGRLDKLDVIERQYESLVRGIVEAKGAANLAGGIAARALEETELVRRDVLTVSRTTERIEIGLGKMAQSMQGLEQASKSLVESVFPPRNGHDPDEESEPRVEFGEIVPFRRNSMTGE